MEEDEEGEESESGEKGRGWREESRRPFLIFLFNSFNLGLTIRAEAQLIADVFIVNLE